VPDDVRAGVASVADGDVEHVREGKQVPHALHGIQQVGDERVHGEEEINAPKAVEKHLDRGRERRFWDSSQQIDVVVAPHVPVYLAELARECLEIVDDVVHPGDDGTIVEQSHKAAKVLDGDQIRNWVKRSCNHRPDLTAAKRIWIQ
jgi:hypothetical protein